MPRAGSRLRQDPAQTPGELLPDEPANHVDIAHQLEVLSLLRRLPATSVVALHDLNLAAMFCDSLAVLRDGRAAAAGPPAEVLTETTIRAVFGVAARVERSAHSGRLHVRYLPDREDTADAHPAPGHVDGTGIRDFRRMAREKT
ncbi:ABC transporter ATP-binding protein [Azospirillum halopraeferens]|uniref:ABC transporter ATP-binding protein n=1 Tax=Azospirillum halopraeferens TaxID=34010 RepID=UPI000429B5D7|nr:ABC transporter ATP-binding protein [Azospirillum halopraeferens]